MSCQLGNLLSPQNGQTYLAVNFPYSILLQVDNDTPTSNFYVQISKSSSFITIDGYVTQNLSGQIFVNVTQPDIYFIRISCDGVNWSGYSYFIVQQASSNEVSEINLINVSLNSQSTGFNVYIPQLLYGPPLNQSPIPLLYYINSLQIDISNYQDFSSNVLRFYNYATKYGQLYKTSCIIPNIDLNQNYYFRVRYYDVINNQWGPYTNLNTVWSNSSGS